MSDLEKFKDIPFDEAAANTVNAKHDQFVSLLLDYEFADICGNVEITLRRYRPTDYEHFRTRDLYILHRLSLILPDMDNDEMTVKLLNNQLNHRIFNTLEGGDALVALVKQIFPDGPISETFSICHYGINDTKQFGRRWKIKFSAPSPIKPEEYLDAEKLRPLTQTPALKNLELL